ncbi:hypothetical protein OAA09_00355 [bacterium]|nr:hypothetical protein [bacterium]
MQYTSLDNLLKHQIVNNELYSFQIVSILLALENFADINDFGIKSYHGWIKSRNKRKPFQSTIDLAILSRSFQINGFNKDFPLELDPDDLMMNGGTHRTACCIFYGIEQIPYTLRARTGKTKLTPKYYGLNYFKDSIFFNDKVVEEMQSRWDMILKARNL